MKKNNKTNAQFAPHVYLEKLINSKFGVFLEIHHDRFSPPIKNHRNKLISARTMVAAYKTKEEAISVKKKQGVIVPICVSASECSVEDQFEKKIGLTKALNRMYRHLSIETKM